MTPEADVLTQSKDTTIGCPKCGKDFKNAIGLRMHDIRKHQSRGWDTSGNFRNTSNWRAKRAKRLANLNRTVGKPWTPEQHIKFRNTMRKKLLAKGLPPKPSNRIRIVYPTPGEIDEAVAATPNMNSGPTSKPYAVTHCPCCGLHLEPIEAVLQQMHK
jgi:hypothetical protein